MLHADSADISSTDIFNRGGKPRFGTTGSGGSALRQCGIFFLIAGAALACGAVEIPKASGKALGVTKGKPFSAGIVFINGRYIPPPYEVERWGVGIRINKIPVMSAVIDWSEFLKTQSGVKVTKTETTVAEPPAPEPEPVANVEPATDDFDMSLDELFDDDPKPKKPAKKVQPRRQPKPAKTSVQVVYSLDGDFEQNDASRALVATINKTRTDINASLMSGGFMCFGDRYPRVAGDARTAKLILEKLPDLMRVSATQESFLSAVRLAGLQFLTDPVCRDIFRNRRDYIKLQSRYERQKQENDIKQLIKETVEKPLL